MALYESTTIAYSNAPPQSPHQPPRPQDEALKDNSISSLNKPSSLFSLTLDEIQLKSGKPFGSMNMDEFLTNLWSSVDDNQVQSQPDRIETMDNNKIIESQQQQQQQPQPPLKQQSSFSIPIQMCKKTVEEVWSDIQKDHPQHQKLVDNNNGSHRQPPQRQQTFGEITLEEFLIKAGIVQEPAKPCQPKIVEPTLVDASYGMGQMIGGLGFSTHPNNFLVNSTYATYPMYTTTKRNVVGEMLPNNGESTTKSLGSVEAAGGVKNNKRRIIDGPPEVVVERRQRRMIKNRESAARSRARKQAYTVELEVELNQLREENEKLKRIVKEYEEKRGQEDLLIRKPLYKYNLEHTLMIEFLKKKRLKIRMVAQKKNEEDGMHAGEFDRIKKDADQHMPIYE